MGDGYLTDGMFFKTLSEAKKYLENGFSKKKNEEYEINDRRFKILSDILNNV